MPFKSDAQRRLFWAKVREGKIQDPRLRATDWEKASADAAELIKKQAKPPVVKTPKTKKTKMTPTAETIVKQAGLGQLLKIYKAKRLLKSIPAGSKVTPESMAALETLRPTLLKKALKTRPAPYVPRQGGLVYKAVSSPTPKISPEVAALKAAPRTRPPTGGALNKLLVKDPFARQVQLVAHERDLARRLGAGPSQSVATAVATPPGLVQRALVA